MGMYAWARGVLAIARPIELFIIIYDKYLQLLIYNCDWAPPRDSAAEARDD